MLFLVAFLILFFSFANNAKEQEVETEIAGNLQSTYLLPFGSPETLINEQILAAKGIIGQEIREYVKNIPWDTETAYKVILCESGGNEKIVSKSGDVGIFQINLVAHWPQIPGNTRSEKVDWLKDYKNNTDFAYGLWQKSGWFPWVCWTKKLL